MDKNLEFKYHMDTGRYALDDHLLTEDHLPISAPNTGYVKWLEENYQAKLKEDKDRVRFILFGFEANEIFKSNTDAADQIADDEIPFGLYRFTGDMEELISEAYKWDGYGLITESEFDTLKLYSR